MEILHEFQTEFNSDTSVCLNNILLGKSNCENWISAQSFAECTLDEFRNNSDSNFLWFLLRLTRFFIRNPRYYYLIPIAAVAGQNVSELLRPVIPEQIKPATAKLLKSMKGSGKGFKGRASGPSETKGTRYAWRNSRLAAPTNVMSRIVSLHRISWITMVMRAVSSH